jgi:hypothetical protein
MARRPTAVQRFAVATDGGVLYAQRPALGDHFIDELIESGSADLVCDLASPVPAAFTLEFVASIP